MTEHDMLLMVQRQREALIAERDALRLQVAALAEERDALRSLVRAEIREVDTDMFALGVTP